MPHILKLADGTVATPMTRDDLLDLVREQMGSEVLDALTSGLDSDDGDLQDCNRCPALREAEGIYDAYHAALIEIQRIADSHLNAKAAETRKLAEIIIDEVNNAI